MTLNKSCYQTHEEKILVPRTRETLAGFVPSALNPPTTDASKQPQGKITIFKLSAGCRDTLKLLKHMFSAPY
jgi:hypothetical protein